MNIKILVATHKPYWMPDDSMYVPIHVGKKLHDAIGFMGDDTGDNISEKNANYCELTGLYWAWKNLDADWLGIAHYRRHFASARFGAPKRQRVIRRDDLEKLLRRTSVILPKQRHYWIETNESQYAHAHHEQDLVMVRQILQEVYPDYVAAYDNVMKRTHGHRFNMFVMRREYVNDYCSWLFDVLFRLEQRLDISAYEGNDIRVFGFVGERLLDVWLEAKQIEYKDIPYVFLDRQNWLEKGWKFISRKFKGDKRAVQTPRKKKES